MTWADFYLICFAVGFLLSAISFVAGGLRMHVHLPHLPHGGSLGHVSGGAVHGGAMTGPDTPPTPRSPTQAAQKPDREPTSPRSTSSR